MVYSGGSSADKITVAGLHNLALAATSQPGLVDVPGNSRIYGSVQRPGHSSQGIMNHTR
jgi:hypothetical protein